MNTHAMPEGRNLPSSAAPAASFNHALHRTPRLCLWWIPSITGAGSVSRNVRPLHTTIAMKRLLALAAFLVIAFIIWFFAHSQPSGLSIGFVGSTNGVIGPIAPTFGKMTTNHAVAIQAWLAAGTNGARFAVTNQHSYAIDIFPVARIYTTNANPMQTPLLNAPTWSGISLAPGQATTVQVAVLPHSFPWRVELCYHRRQSSGWASAMFESMSGALKATHTTQSDWIEK